MIATRQLACIFATAFAVSAACAADNAGTDNATIDNRGTNPGAGASIFSANDSEGFTTERVALDYLPFYTNRYAMGALRVAASRFAQDGWRRESQQLGVVYRKLDPATLDGIALDAGLSRQGRHDALTVDANWHTTLAASRSIELFFNRDWVETRAALTSSVAFSYAGASLEQGLGEHFTLVGMGGYQDFTDGNARRHLRAKLIYQPSLALGLTLQARYRLFHSDADLPRTYFNPERYDESMLAVGYRQRWQGWMGNLTAGVGRQQVGSDARTGSRLLELGLESPVRQRQSLRLRAGFSDSASFGGPDYQYRYLQAEWLVGF